MSQVKKNYLLKRVSTMGIGGPAKYFARAASEVVLADHIAFAEKKRLGWSVIGEGSNIVPSDNGFRGLIIQNTIELFERKGATVKVGAGNNLLKLIYKLDRLGLAGLERMAGIPGSVGGAVYGSAGAYGQEIKDRVVRVKYFDSKLNKFKWLTKRECRFAYRDSIFKQKKHWLITAVELRLDRGRGLTKVSGEIIRLRLKKYKKGLKCPGSFFKNIKLDELSAGKRKILLSKIDPQKVVYGKVPVGYLLEEVGAKGMGRGSIKVADHHANLLYNLNGGKARDIKRLAETLKMKVKRKFGIMIEEEVQYL